MTVALLLPQGYQPAPLLFWAVRIASARKQPLAVLDVQQSQQTAINPIPWHNAGKDDAENAAPFSEVIEALRAAPCRDALNEDDSSATADGQRRPSDDTVACRLIEIRHEDLEDTVLTELRRLDASLLVLPRHRGVKPTAAEFELQRHLFANANCAAVQLSLSDKDAVNCDRILVPTRGSRNTADAIRLATDLAESEGGIVTALFVQPDVDAAAAEVGKRTIERLVHRFADDTEQRVATESVLSDEVPPGILEYARHESDLIILGASYHSVVHRLLFSSIAEEVISAEHRPAVAVIRPASPLGSRVVAACENILRDVVPQLDRKRPGGIGQSRTRKFAVGL